MMRRTLFDFDKAWDLAQKWFFVPLIGLILILLLAWSIDSVRTWMQGHGLKELDVPAVVGITLAATMFILLAFQQQLEKDLDGTKKFADMSVTDTIRTCIATGLHKKAERLRSDFKVPDKRFDPYIRS